MAILAMKKILICGMKKDRKSVLEFLQRQGVVEINSDDYKDDVFTSADTSASSASFMKEREACDVALEVLNELCPEKTGLFADFSVVDKNEYEELVSRRDDFSETAKKIVDLNKMIAEKSAEIPRLEMQIEALTPWKGLDIPLDLAETKTTALIAGTFAGKMNLQDLYTGIAQAHPEVDAFDTELISAEEEQTCVLFIVRKDQAALLEDALRQLNFARAPLSSLNPAEEIAALTKQIDEDQKTIEETKQAVIALASEREHIKFIRDYYAMRADKYDAIGKLAQTKRTFILSGYVAEADLKKIMPTLDSMDLEVTVTDPEEGEDTPIKLKNGGFTAPMEAIVKNYSIPNRTEIDPSSIIAIFYYIFFGMMLSDAAYGIIMVIGCAYFLTKRKNMDLGMRRFLTMFLYCGISTTIWGFLFGGFFGDLVNVVATTFFNRPDIKIPAIWFEPVNTPMKLLVFAFALGIIHIFVALFVKLVQCLKNGDVKGAIFDVVFWYMIVGGLILCGMTTPMLMTDMFALPFILPASIRTACLIVAAIGAVGVIFTEGRASKNWGKRILKGLYGVYGVSSYLSDVLSYSRLLGLGLATGVIATVFNAMASMVAGAMLKKGAIGAILAVIIFIVIFLIGHGMNMAINALGAYVHTNRLQYVEFFGKFYEGGGREIDPLTENTKYYKVKEVK